MAKVRKRIWTSKEGTKRECWYLDYVNEKQKRIRVGNYSTKKEADDVLAKIRVGLNEGTRVTPDKTLTFNSAFEKYIESIKAHCKPSTFDGYKSYFKNHLEPFFGDMKLIDISISTIESFVNEKKFNNKLSDNTINKMLILIGSIFKNMIKKRYIFYNPAYDVKKFKIYPKEMRFLDEDEINAVLEVAKIYYKDFYPMLLMAITCGLRRGELCGLTWDSVNFIKKQIYVKQSLYKGQLITPKTPTSIRKVNMPDELVKVLKEWKLRCPKGEGNFVFPNTEGKAIDPDNMIKRQYEPVIRKAGIGKANFHSLRHTYCALLISKNVPIKYIQRQMGHSSIQITIDRYGHLMPETDQKAIESINEFLCNNSANSSMAVNL